MWLQVPLSKIAIWIDFSCIDQDDRELQAKGIGSLLTYAARSAYSILAAAPAEQQSTRRVGRLAGDSPTACYSIATGVLEVPIPSRPV